MNLFSARDFPRNDLKYLFHEARILSLQDELQSLGRGSIDQTMNGKVMGTLFLEPSTRTRWSFETAFNKLGGRVVSTEAGSLTTSKVKGESLSDSIKTVSQYVDFLVVRSPEPIPDWGIRNSDLGDRCSLINAGDGSREHPTQALTDAYTIYRKFGRLSDLNIGIIGDIKQSRTIHSFIKIMGESSNQIIVWPQGSRTEEFLGTFVTYGEFPDYNQLKDCNVIYLNRIQQERWKDTEVPETVFRLNQDYLNLISKDAIILNPGPRKEEMSSEYDSDPRIKYFEQAKNGMYVRMALLNYLGENKNGPLPL